jgi:DNA repair photolyase
MQLDALNDKDCDELINNVSNKVSPVFNGHTVDEKRAIYRYLFSRRPKKIPPSMKNRLIGLYNPMADRSNRFPDGLRWCINVYVGCEHNCGYCYVNGYNQEGVGISPHARSSFDRKLNSDIQELISLGVPPAPLHMSNSTDLFQQRLEVQNRHALLSLQQIAKHREQFTSIVILTKNPRILCSDPYLSLISSNEMSPFTVQVSCAYWKDDVRLFYEPNAPNIQDRLEAIEILVENGIDVELRIDPLFPSSRIKEETRLHKPLSNYSLPEAQSHDDIINLVRFAKKSGVKSVIAKPLKVPVSKKAQRCKDWFSLIYRDAHRGKKRSARGGSWRLSDDYQKELVSTLANLCSSEGVGFKHCMHDVLTRN